MRLTAKEAKAFIPVKEPKEVNEICEEIKILATQGWKSALWYLKSEQIDELKSLGYDVDNAYGDGAIYRIKWSE